MEAQRQGPSTSAGLLILRLGIGGFMLTHGVPKLRLLLAGEFGAMGDPIGIGSTATLVLLVFAEFFCALLVMLGLATRLAAAPIVIAMAVAAFVAHADDPWTMQEAAQRFFAQETPFPAAKQGALMFLIPFLALILTGAGRFSLDALIWPRKKRDAEAAEQSPASDAARNHES